MNDIRILFVDHHKDVLTRLELLLQEETFQKTFVNNAKDALDVLSGQDVHVIVCDLMIDNMDGLTLLQLIHKQFPHIIRLAFCEEKNLIKIIHCINNTDIFRYIEKPINKESLIKTLHDAVAQFFFKPG